MGGRSRSGEHKLRGEEQGHPEGSFLILSDANDGGGARGGMLSHSDEGRWRHLGICLKEVMEQQHS